jgi:hypothetical protein
MNYSSKDHSLLISFVLSVVFVVQNILRGSRNRRGLRGSKIGLRATPNAEQRLL